MALQIALFQDPFHTSDALIPRVVQPKVISYEELIRRVSSGAREAPTKVRAVIDETIDTLVGLLSDGGQVRTPMGTFGLNVHRKRQAAGRNGSKPQRRRSNCDTYSLSISLRPSRSLTRRVQQETQITTVPQPKLRVPSVDGATNLESGESDGNLYPGALIRVSGCRLSFRPSDAETGLFFVSLETAGQVRATFYTRRGWNYVDSRVPALPPGRYRLEIRTRPTGRAVRKGSYGRVLTVVDALLREPAPSRQASGIDDSRQPA